MRVCIIGGGISALFSAYYLGQSQHELTLVDQHAFDQGASYGNAGMICPSHFIPLAAPGVILQSLKWMFNSTSPFYLKPRLDPDFLRWGWQFFNHCNKSHVQDSIGPLYALLHWSRTLYQNLAGEELHFSLQKKGIVMACNSNHALTEEISLSKKANRLGISTRILSLQEIEQLNPGVQFKLKGGIHYQDDAHLIPEELMAALKTKLNPIVKWKPNTQIIEFIKKGPSIERILTNHGDIAADAFIIAAGAWSPGLAQRAGGKIFIQGGKGYNVTIEQANPQLNTPMILVEGRVAITPMGHSLRLGGTMELAGLNNQMLPGRVEGILRTIESYLPDYPYQQLNKIKPWFGFRPLTPTGLPLISRLNPVENVYINTGHGMLGLSLAPACGRILNQMICNHRNTS